MHVLAIVGQAYLIFWLIVLAVLVIHALAVFAQGFVAAHLRRWQGIPDKMFICRHGRVVLESGDCRECDSPDPIESQMPAFRRPRGPLSCQLDGPTAIREVHSVDELIEATR